MEGGLDGDGLPSVGTSRLRMAPRSVAVFAAADCSNPIRAEGPGRGFGWRTRTDGWRLKSAASKCLAGLLAGNHRGRATRLLIQQLTGVREHGKRARVQRVLDREDIAGIAHVEIHLEPVRRRRQVPQIHDRLVLPSATEAVICAPLIALANTTAPARRALSTSVGRSWRQLTGIGCSTALEVQPIEAAASAASTNPVLIFNVVGSWWILSPGHVLPDDNRFPRFNAYGGPAHPSQSHIGSSIYWTARRGIEHINVVGVLAYLPSGDTTLKAADLCDTPGVFRGDRLIGSDATLSWWASRRRIRNTNARNVLRARGIQ